MDYHEIVVNIFRLVSNDIKKTSNSTDRGKRNFEDKSPFIRYNNKIIYLKSETENNIQYYRDEFKSFSLIDLHNILILLIPFATNFYGTGGNSPYVWINTLEHVKLTLKYISKEIKSLCNGNTNSESIRLISENRDLTNKYDVLKQKYDAMREIFNDPK